MAQPSASAPSPLVASLLEGLDEAFRKKSWHGTNLAGSLRGLPAASAAWRPAPGRRNAWELVLHCAYWKYVVRRRLTGEKRGRFVLPGSNFFERPAAGTGDLDLETAWKADVALLVEQHRLLRETVAALPATFGTTKADAKRLHLLHGAAAHDLYHAGQIQLLKRLQR